MSVEEAAAPHEPRTLASRPPEKTLMRGGFGVFLAVVLLIMFDGPSWLSVDDLVLAITLFNLMAMAQAWNLIGGYGGQFSLGHGLFVAVGGYTVALVLTHTGVSLAVSVLMAGCVSALVGVLMAIPLLRLRGVYFSVGTLGVLIAAQSWVINWKFAGQTTGVYLPASGTLGFNTQYYMVASLLVLTTAVVAGLVRSRYGLRLMAVRDDESAASELGVNGFRVKLVALTISAFLVG
jgi:branched-chain amino acid transport system permease protein